LITDMNDKNRDSLIEHTRSLVRIPSRSSADGGEEGAVQQVVADRMRELGARLHTFEARDIPGFFEHPLCHGPWRQYDGRPTVVGEIGPSDAPALLVLAHSDTVQIGNPSEWTVDPFGGIVKDGAIWGLGSSDDKWGLATMFVILEALQAAGRPLNKRIIFASTIDEENGVGNGMLLLHLAGVQAESALYLDGYRMVVLVGNMGGSTLFFSPKEPLSADDLSSHENRLRAMCDELSRQREHLYDRPLYRENITRRSSVAFMPGYGTGPAFKIGFYTFPEDDKDSYLAEIMSAIQNALGDAAASYNVACREPWFEPSLPPLDTPLIGYLSDSIRSVLGVEPQMSTISKQDSFILNNHASIPVVAFGCQPNLNERGAFHMPDEKIGLEEVWNGCRIAYETVCRWLAR